MRAVGPGESESWIWRVRGLRPWRFYLEPPSPIGPFVGVDVSIVRYPILGSSQPEGLSFVACPDHSGSKISSVSSLTGVIEQNPGSSFVMGSA